MSKTYQDRDHKLYTEYIKQMMIDYVVNDMSNKALQDKYKLTSQAVNTIIDKHKFREKRLQYQEKVLQNITQRLEKIENSISSKKEDKLSELL